MVCYDFVGLRVFVGVEKLEDQVDCENKLNNPIRVVKLLDEIIECDAWLTQKY